MTHNNERIGQSKPGMPTAIRWLLVSAAALVLSVLLPLTAFAEGSAQITVDSPGQVRTGEEFTVPVNIRDNPGIAGATFVVHYNGNALELVDITDGGGVLVGGLTVNTEADTVGYLTFPNDNTENGLLFNAVFRVKDGAESGDYEVSVGLKDNLEKNFVNSEAQVVPVTFAAGTVAIDGVAVEDTGDGPTTTTPGTTPDTTTPTITTGDGTEVTESVDVKAPISSEPRKVDVGVPFFVNAEEGSLSWDTDVLEGAYDPVAGGYVLTPKASGDTTLTYRDENGDEKTIELEIGEAVAPLAEGGTEASDTGTGVNPIILVAIVVVVLVAGVTMLVIWQRRRSAAAATVGRHRANRAR